MTLPNLHSLTDGQKKKLSGSASQFLNKSNSAQIGKPTPEDWVIAKIETAAIPLIGGGYALADARDIPLLSLFKWKRHNRNGHYYAVAYSKSHGRYVMMHRIILDAPKGKEVDHINGNGLDNRRENLRKCTTQQNSFNKRMYRGAKSSKYKGVTWHKRSRKWHARIRHNYAFIQLGYFTKELDAAQAYDKKAKELFGEFAHPNFRNAEAA